MMDLLILWTNSREYLKMIKTIRKKKELQQLIFTRLSVFSAAMIGFSVAIYTVGIEQINIFNNKWLWGDLFQVYIAWAQHNLDQCPMCLVTDRLSFPLQMPLALFDPMPLLLMLLSWVSPLLPENSQYFGVYFIICLMLQGILGYLATIEVVKNITSTDSTQHTIIAFLGAIFFAVTPFTFWRFQGHTALSSQWVIVLGIWLALRFRNSKNNYWITANAGVAFLAAGLSPYLALMVIATPLCFTFFDLVSRHISSLNALVRVTAVIMACSISLYIFGFASAAITGIHRGYGYYSMDILGPLDSNGKALLLQLDIPDATGGQTFEGFDYLGLGLLTMIATSSILALRRQQLYPLPTWLFPALLIVGGSYCFALSINLTFNGSLITIIPVPQQLIGLLSAFRASGRLFWIGGFWLILIAIALIIRALPYRVATIVFSIFALVQLIDVAGVAFAVRTSIGTFKRLSLTNGEWALPIGHYSTLIALPPFQCNSNEKLGGERGYEILGEFALQHSLKINSFYAARTLPEQAEYHCNLNNALSLDKPVRKDTIYVLSNALFSKYHDYLMKTHDCKFFNKYSGLNFCWPRVPELTGNTLAIVTPPLLGKGFYKWEGGIDRFAWSSGDAELWLNNPNKNPINVKLYFEITTLLPRDVIISINRNLQDIKIHLKPGEPQRVTLNLKLVSGKTKLNLKTDIPAQLPGNSDTRKLAFSITNVDLQLTDQEEVK